MRFTIIGTERKTDREVDFQLQADSRDAALLEAQNKGILVRTIEPIADVPEQIIPSPVIALDYQPAIDEYPIKSRWIWVASFLGLELISGITLFILLSGHTIDPIAFAQFAFFAVIFLSLQFATMLPVIRPRPAPGPGKPALLWIGAAATGLLLGLLVMGTLFMAADFLWSFDISNSAHDNLGISAIVFSGIF